MLKLDVIPESEKKCVTKTQNKKKNVNSKQSSFYEPWDICLHKEIFQHNNPTIY